MTTLLTIAMITTVLGIVDVLSIGSFGLVPLEAAFLAFFFASLKYTVWEGKPLRLPRTPEFFWLIAIWIAMLLSSIAPLISFDPDRIVQVAKTHSHFTLMWLFAVVCACIPIELKAWTKMIRVQFLVMALIGLYGIYQIPARAGDWPGAWMEVTNSSYEKMTGTDVMQQISLRFGDFHRATSIFSEPSALAAYCVLGLTLLIVPFVRRSGRILQSTTLAYGLLIILVLALFLTFSITGLMLLSASLALLMWRYPKRVLRKSVMTVMILGSVIYAGDMVAENIAGISVLDLFDKRLTGLFTGSAAAGETEISGESYNQRSGDYKASMNVFTEAPVTGVGAGNFSLSYHGSRHDSLYPATTFGTVIAEMGLLGIIAYFAFMMSMIAGSLDLLTRWEAMKDRHGMHPGIDSIIAIIPFVAVLAFVTGINANILVNSYWWFWFGFIQSVMMYIRKELGLLTTREFYLIRSPLKNTIAFRKPAHLRVGAGKHSNTDTDTNEHNSLQSSI